MPSRRIEGRRIDRRRIPSPRGELVALVVACCSALSGCDLPRDPEGTLSRVRNGVIRVGVTPHGRWVESDEGQPPTGIEPTLVEDFARQLGAEVRWYRGSETQVLTALETFELDLVVGGLTDDTLWSDRVGLSQPYFETEDRRHVMAVAPGENAFLLQLDRFLKSREEAIAQELRKAAASRKVERP